MFEAMMEAIKDDFVRYIFRLEVVADDDARRPAQNLQYSARRGPGAGHRRLRGGRARRRRSRSSAVRRRPDVAEEARPQQPVRVEKTPGRNEPCYCGSGKKYKLCHGR